MDNDNATAPEVATPAEETTVEAAPAETTEETPA